MIFRFPYEEAQGNGFVSCHSRHMRHKPVHTATALKKRLHFHPHKVTVVHELQERDYIKRSDYCRWFRDNGGDMMEVTFFSDEAWFHLSG